MKIMNRFNLIKGFSLVEVMITLIILSVATVALAPMVTKKFPENKNYGVLYTYLEGNSISTSNKCFVSNSNTDTNYASTYDCSKYTFTVPDGVGFVNLTLVGGGGGGGGAGGSNVSSSYVQNGTVSGQFTRSGTLYPELLKSIIINYLTSYGSAASDDCNSNCGDSELCGQKGGTSAPSLGDYPIPFNMIHGYNYKNPLLLSDSNKPTLAYYLFTTDYDSSKGNSYLTFTNSQDSSSLGPKFYAVYKSSYSGYTRGNTSYLYYTYGNTTKKTFPHEYEKPPVEGDYGVCMKPNDTVYYRTSLMGGLGGRNNIASSFGSGEGGRSCTVYCKSSTSSSCLAKNASCLKNGDTYTYSTGSGSTTITWSCSNGTCGSSRYHGAGVKFTYTYEYPPGGGGGGAAGTFVRITGFPVTQGETYTIYVGKGGEGGQGGVSGSAVAGSAGTGGVSTAIFDSSGNLIFMAMGGNYGAGGTKATTTLAAPTVATSGRNYSVVAYGSSYKDNLIVDTNFMTLGSTVTAPSGAGGAKRLTYSAFDASPYKGMNMNSNSYVDGKYGGFSNLNTTGQYYKNVTITNKESASTVYAPDGLFYRTLIDGDQNSGYIGGLGGFTGFGGKAGCGGYFLGNFDGRSGTSSDIYTTTSPTTTYSSWLKNTFIPQESDGTLYSVFKYYDNCTSETPNGQTADFVEPDPVAMTFGQAGSGGGGGGFSIMNGSGSGGSGQNGYLMIDWRK
ncbi:MAG: prepilin-type N-terminal cleavage/methylation domain-containing protein [Candidatus Gastranaerophilales bacterium]|nr:prepilin-type N-terminal cleavage/methylation domain-containing protein [Candidatus Gastranaerophilales bacterium]